MTTDLRERAHELMRAELADTALDVILHNGYDALTVDDLARSLGISRATFFRYLGSKDDAIVTAMLGPDDLFSQALATSTHQPTASQWQRLRPAFEPLVVSAADAPERLRARVRLVQAQPSVGARLRRARAPQIDRLAATLANRGTGPFAAHILATAAVAVFDQCLATWANNHLDSLRHILDEAFTQLDAASLPPKNREKNRVNLR